MILRDISGSEGGKECILKKESLAVCQISVQFLVCKYRKEVSNSVPKIS